MSIDLAISLGHNSSCVAISSQTGEILCGFEQERLSGIKSDSVYPILAIEQCMKVLNRPKVRYVYISHWFADGRLIKSKYYDPNHMQSLGADTICSVDKRFTHHDAHNYSALAFAQSDEGFEDGFHSFVVDGFGTAGECLSIYECTSNTAYYAKTRLLHRAFGYNKSLGILYQYATAFLGMKMQQDEYKLLGYEAHQDHLDDDDLEKIEDYAAEMSSIYLDGIRNPMAIDKDKDPIVNLNALKATKDGLFSQFWDLLNEMDISDRTTFEAKVVISMLVQKVVENVVIQLVMDYNVKKLICSGGVFMNVKLNSMLSKIVDKICVMPLAGDQGAALGLYHYNHKNLKWPDHLYWGHRTWDNIGKFDDVRGIRVFTDRDAFINSVIHEIRETGYVNVVMGDMEYGPRALCNTTTLALPSPENTEAINKLNDRTTVMPMAPVMTEEMARARLNPDFLRYHKSLEYMIGACVLNPGVNDMDGAAHQYKGKWFGQPFKTCRPQIINEQHLVYTVLQELGHPLINTSFNYHGVPIVYSVEDIIKSHVKQNENGEIKTFVLVENS